MPKPPATAYPWLPVSSNFLVPQSPPLYISNPQLVIYTIKHNFPSQLHLNFFKTLSIFQLFSSIKRNRKMSSTSKAWAVATSIAAVEALKDQGFCRWNYTIRSLYQHAKNQGKSSSLPKKLSSPVSTVVASKVRENQKARQSEESLRQVMYLSCWGPYQLGSKLPASNYGHAWTGCSIETIEVFPRETHLEKHDKADFLWRWTLEPINDYSASFECYALAIYVSTYCSPNELLNDGSKFLPLLQQFASDVNCNFSE